MADFTLGMSDLVPGVFGYQLIQPPQNLELNYAVRYRCYDQTLECLYHNVQLIILICDSVKHHVAFNCVSINVEDFWLTFLFSSRLS